MKRNPLIHWLLVMATFGQYAFVWGFRLAKDVDRLSPAHPIPVQKHARIFAFGYVIYVAAAIALSARLWSSGPSASMDSAFFSVYFLGVGLVVYFIWLLARIAKKLRSISQSEAPKTSTVIGLSFLWMTSLPLLQSHANKNA